MHSESNGTKYEASLAFLVEYKFTPCPCNNHTP